MYTQRAAGLRLTGCDGADGQDGFSPTAIVFTPASPLALRNGELSIDLPAYAALAGATFTGAVTGITPTSNMHFTTKKYVDDAITALTNLDQESF